MGVVIGLAVVATVALGLARIVVVARAARATVAGREDDANRLNALSARLRIATATVALVLGVGVVIAALT